MCKDGKIMFCITGENVREIVSKANDLKIPREDIINMFVLGRAVYLIYYK